MKKTKERTKAPERPASRDDREGGWTFIETLIVIGIILILSSSVGFMAVKYLDRARVVTARSQIDTFSLALDSYYLDCGKYPTQDQGLRSLWEKPAGESEGWKGPYVSKPIPKDPWGNDYGFAIPGENGLPFRIVSLGADGAEGGEGNDEDISTGE